MVFKRTMMRMLIKFSIPQSYYHNEIGFLSFNGLVFRKNLQDPTGNHEVFHDFPMKSPGFLIICSLKPIPTLW